MGCRKVRYLMLKEDDGSRYSLSKSVFAATWVLSLSLVGRYMGTDLTNGSEVAAVIASILTPAGLVYAARSHTKKGANNA